MVESRRYVPFNSDKDKVTAEHLPTNNALMFVKYSCKEERILPIRITG